MKKKTDNELYQKIRELVEEANPEMKKSKSEKSHLKVVHKKKNEKGI